MNSAPYDYHDPYREVEQYLLKAEEEIGRAFEELKESERSDRKLSNTVLCSPQVKANEYFDNQPNGYAQCRKPQPFQNWSATWHPGTDRTDDLRWTNTFPRKSNNCNLQATLINGNDINDHQNRTISSLPPLESKPSQDATVTADRNSALLDASFAAKRRHFQRSISDLGPSSKKWVDCDDDDDVFPRPPSGDVYLLSVWAEDLVKHVNRTLDNGEFDSTVRSSSSQLRDSEDVSSPCDKPTINGAFSRSSATTCKFSERFRPTNLCNNKETAYSNLRHLSFTSNGELWSRYGNLLGRRASYPGSQEDSDRHGLFLEAFNGASAARSRSSHPTRSTKDSAVQTGEEDEKVAERLVITRLQENSADRIVVTNFQDGSTVKSVTKEDSAFNSCNKKTDDVTVLDCGVKGTKDENFNDTFADSSSALINKRIKDEILLPGTGVNANERFKTGTDYVSDTDSTHSFMSAEEPNDDMISGRQIDTILTSLNNVVIPDIPYRSKQDSPNTISSEDRPSISDKENALGINHIDRKTDELAHPDSNTLVSDENIAQIKVDADAKPLFGLNTSVDNASDNETRMSNVGTGLKPETDNSIDEATARETEVSSDAKIVVEFKLPCENGLEEVVDKQENIVNIKSENESGESRESDKHFAAESNYVSGDGLIKFELHRVDSTKDETVADEKPGSACQQSTELTCSSSHVSPHELEFFMRGVESSAYQPPPASEAQSKQDKIVESTEEQSETTGDDDDLNADVSCGSEATDAVTQTSPQLSRSSSFTWVTECDCSDWDLTGVGLETSSASEESLSTYSSSGLSSESENNTDFCTADSSSSISIGSGGGEPDKKPTEDKKTKKSALLLTTKPIRKEGSNSSLSLSDCSVNGAGSPCCSNVEQHKETISSDCKENNGEPNASTNIPIHISAPVTPTGDHDHSSDKSGITLDNSPSSSTTLSGSDALNSTAESLLETKSDSGIPIHGNARHHAVSPCLSLPKSILMKPLDLKPNATSSLKTRKWKHLDPANDIIWNNVKSSSAPLLPPHFNLASSSSVSQRGVPKTTANTPVQEEKVLVPPRSQSVKELSELEALEACAWLRAAGFPQYAQMYEDNLFPIDISSVQKDHEFLDSDSIQSLFRRLYTLNKCAKMKIDMLPRKAVRTEDSDEEEEQCALSENWQFQRSSRRWSRIPSPIHIPLSNGISVPTSSKLAPMSPTRKHLTPEEAYSSSHDSVFVDDQGSSPENTRKKLSISYEDTITPSSPIPMDEDIALLGCCPASGSIPSCESDLGLEKSPDMLDVTCTTLRRSGSERLKDSARALLRRMESLKGKRKKKQNQESSHGSSEASIATQSTSGAAEPSPSSSMASSPRIIHQRNESAMSDADSPLILDGSDGSQESTPQVKHRKRVWRLLGKNDVGGDSSAACSDSECSSSGFARLWKNGNIPEAQLIEQLMPACDEAVLSNGVAEKERRGKRMNGSFHIRRDDKQSPKHTGSPEREGDNEERVSLYDNVPLVVFNRTCSVEQQNATDNELAGKPWTFVGSAEHDQDSGSLLSTGAGNSDQDTHGSQEEVEVYGVRSERRDSGVGASLTRSYNCCQSAHVKWHCFPVSQQCSSLSGPRSPSSLPLHINALSALQLMMLRKRSLLKLTALMEKYSPSSRTGWNWAVPKFIRRIRAPDYKDKVVFGVPLLVNLQRTGQPLPSSIQAAIRHLRKTALDSTGLFRKSGVRSRIQKLRNQNESNPETINYDNQQCYDVADMLKQYFRELPEALLTNKLSETFISIFQYIPEELRLQAIQASVLLMPDENREVLQSLLSFLREVCEHASENQMTASNLAVCFAPSLFHLTTPRSASASPRRRKTVGVPDQRELNENRAAHECLTRMIVDYSHLFQLPEEVLLNSRVTEHFDPASLEELGTCSVRGHCSWKAYVDGCIQALLKETREKFKGWVMVLHNDNVELSYKKVGDGFPLRLWKASVDVEAPPVELLSRILRERHLWDEGLLKWRLVTKLDKQSEVFQYVCNSLPPHPPRNYCVLRSWRTDLPKGTCVLIEASVDHPDAPLMLDGIRGMVLASRYLIEPCGAGKSRVTHISRIDTRGRSPEWYNKAYGHISATLLVRLRDSFKHGTEGPETKV